jgi:hypothetical protein
VPQDRTEHLHDPSRGPTAPQGRLRCRGMSRLTNRIAPTSAAKLTTLGSQSRTTDSV